MAELGTGSTITHAGVTSDLLSLSLDDVAREAVEHHHMGSTGVRGKLYPTTYSGGKLTATSPLDGTETYDTPMAAASGSVAIALGDGEIWTWGTLSAMTSYGFDDPLDEVMTMTAVFDLGVVVVITP